MRPVTLRARGAPLAALQWARVFVVALPNQPAAPRMRYRSLCGPSCMPFATQEPLPCARRPPRWAT